MVVVDPSQPVELSVSDFIALHNQVMEYAIPRVTIVGELANLRISQNRWIYFDLKDETSKLHFFGTVYQLPGPLEDGLMLRVTGAPRLSAKYGFSVNVQSIQPAGAGSLKRASDLLEAKLKAEGLFAEGRKRPLPYPPQSVGLITSSEAAAYSDFIKVLNARWRDISVTMADVQVQGEAAPAQLIAAVEEFNSLAEPPEVLVVIRGGGSADDLQAFSQENVVRAVAASRIPTLVAIGHERDVSLAELAADRRASTPSNAAELLTPDAESVRTSLTAARTSLSQALEQTVRASRQQIAQYHQLLLDETARALARRRQRLDYCRQTLKLLDPTVILQRGYALVRDESGRVVRSTKQTKPGQSLKLQLADGEVHTKVE